MVTRTQLILLLLALLVAASFFSCIGSRSGVEYFADETRGPFGQSDLSYSRFVTNQQEPLDPASGPLILTSLPGGTTTVSPPLTQMVPTLNADLVQAAPMLGPAVSPTVRTTVPQLFGVEAASATTTAARPSTVPPPADGRIALPPSAASLAMAQNLYNA